MEARHGTCADCQAKYKVPATFKADKARCKACGGVVEIGPIVGAGAPAAEAPPARPAPRDTPAAPPAVPAEKPAPRQATGPVARPVKPKTEKPAARPARATRAPNTSRTTRPARARASEAAAETEDAPAKSRTRATAGKGGSSGRRAAGATRAGAKRSSARSKRSGAGDEDEEAGSARAGGRRRGTKPKKKSPMPLIALVGVAVIAGGVGWFMLNDGSEEVSAKDTGETAAAPDPAVSDDSGADESLTVDEGNGLSDSTTGTEDAPATPAADEEPEKPKKKTADPDSVDLLALAEFGPAPETSAEDWAQYQEWVVAVIDPDSGVLGTRARASLEGTGRGAFPALINGMRGLNYGSEVHMRSGDRCQTALQEILNGINFGWRYTTSPEDEYFNKKVVVAFHKQWVKAENDLPYWSKMAKLDADQAAALRAELGDVVDSPSHDDDDLFDIED